MVDDRFGSEMRAIFERATSLGSKSADHTVRPVSFVHAWLHPATEGACGGWCQVNYLARQIISSIASWAERDDGTVTPAHLLVAIMLQGDSEALEAFRRDGIDKDDLLTQSLNMLGWSDTDAPDLSPLEEPGTCDVPPLLLTELPAGTLGEFNREIERVAALDSESWEELWADEQIWLREMADAYALSSEQSSSLRSNLLRSTQHIVAVWNSSFEEWSELDRGGQDII